MRIRMAAALMSAALVGGALSACGADDDGKSQEAGTLKVGVAASCSGAMAEAGGASGRVCAVYEAWADDLNERGGINGHEVELIVMDDGGNAGTSQTQVRELVEKEEVIAIFGSPPTPQFGDYLQQKGIPFIAAGAYAAEFLKHPLFFNVSMNPVALTYGLVQESAKAGFEKLGLMYCAEDPACARAEPLLVGAAQANGVTMETVKVAATAPDYTAQCLAFKEAGVEVMQVGSAVQVVQRVIEGCASQGYNVKLMAAAGSIDASFLETEAGEGLVALGGIAPWFDSSVPGIKAMQDTLAAAGVDADSPGVADAWASAKTFEAAAVELGDDATAADVIEGLYALDGETSDGLTQPLTFVKGKPNISSSNCYFPFTITDGAYASTSGGKPVCIEPEKLQPFFTALAG